MLRLLRKFVRLPPTKRLWPVTVKTKKVINDNKASYEAELTLLVKNHAETEARIKRLVESLSVASETSAKYVMEQIDELHRQSEQEQTRIAELESLLGRVML